MKNLTRNWNEVDKDYWENSISNYVVREIGRTELQEWVILDDRGMMVSCEWKCNKEDCFEEADKIYREELISANA